MGEENFNTSNNNLNSILNNFNINTNSKNMFNKSLDIKEINSEENLNEILISFVDISKSFDKQIVLENLKLDIYKNEILGLLGKSGCGKSTLIKILLGFYKPDSGLLLYENINLLKHFKKIKLITGFVSQENSFYEKLSVEENLTLFAKLYKVPKNQLEYRIKYLLNLVKLLPYKDKLSENLSGGMKRRLEFAISLIHDPKILILDEPFNGLDVLIIDDIWDVIKKIRDSGVTILIATHILNSAKKHCDRVVFINNNRIVAQIKDLKKYDFDLDSKFKEIILN